jgi:hypothetical protein
MMDINMAKNHFIEIVFELRGKVRLLELHESKPWLVCLTASSHLYIWDYSVKHCVRALHTSQLDLEEKRSLELKGLCFFDHEALLQHGRSAGDLHWLVGAGDRGLFFYDYVFEQTLHLQWKDSEGKGARTVRMISAEHLLVGCQDGTLKLVAGQPPAVLRTYRGFYTRAITGVSIFPAQECTRVLVGAGDGQLACWNITAAGEAPEFRFQTGKAKKDDEILCLGHLGSFLVYTMTEDQVVFWNALSGSMAKTLKHKGFKQVTPFRHIEFS